MGKLSCLSGRWGNRLSWSKGKCSAGSGFCVWQNREKNTAFFQHKPESSWCVGTSLHGQMFFIRYRVIAYFLSNQSVLTLYRLAFRAEMKSYPVQYEQQRNAGNWNKSLTHLDGTSYRSGWPRGFWARGVLNKVLYGKATPQRLTPYPF